MRFRIIEVPKIVHGDRTPLGVNEGQHMRRHEQNIRRSRQHLARQTPMSPQAHERDNALFGSPGKEAGWWGLIEVQPELMCSPLSQQRADEIQ